MRMGKYITELAGIIKVQAIMISNCTRLIDKVTSVDEKLEAVIDALQSSEPSIRLTKNLDNIMRGVQHENSSSTDSTRRQ